MVWRTYRYKKNQRRSQLSMFFILGLILIFAMLLLGFAASFINEMKIRREAKHVLEIDFKEKGVENFVKECISRVTETALRKAFLQGMILNQTNSKTILFDNGTFSVNISYVLLPPNRSIQGNFAYPLPPLYPIPNKKLNEIKDTYEYMLYLYSNNLLSYSGEAALINFLINATYYSGFLGVNALLPLCNVTGKNFNWSSSQLSLSRRPCLDATIQGILDYQPYGHNSLEDQLKHYIEKNLPQCVNLSVFNKITGINYTTTDTPNIEIKFSTNNIQVEAAYPLNITYKRRSISLLKTFTNNINIPLVHIHNALSMVLLKESRDPFFNITDENIFKKDDYLIKNVSIFRCPFYNISNGGPLNCTDPYATVIKLTYNLSFSSGDPIEVFLAINNRAPALDYIHEGCGISYKGKRIDLCVLENKTIKISPFGIDPDELAVFYNYSGWQETVFEWFNFSKCMAYGGPVNCSNISEIRKAIEIIPIQPHNFTNSPEFIATGRNASYKTSRNDTGVHFLIVEVIDPSGKKDYQNVTILVFDLPLANFTFTSIYNDIIEDVASLEDPFLLNASGSRASIIGNPNQLFFNWTILDNTNNQETYNLITQNKETYLPLQYTPNSFPPDLIKNIKNIITQGQGIFPHTGTYKIRLIVAEQLEDYPQGGVIYSEPFEKDIEVFECLPHRSSDFPYPYNHNNPFFANHTCCDISGQIFGTSKICFNTTFYGEFNMLQDKLDQLNIPIGEPFTTTTSGNPPQNPAQENDIYKLSFSRSCSGQRGNTCGGNIIATFTNVLQCEDNPELPLYAQGHGSIVGRCEGPPTNILENLPSECEKYTDETFESIFKGASSTSCWTGAACNGDVFVSALTCDNGACTKPLTTVNCNDYDTCVDTNNDGFSDIFKDYSCSASQSGCVETQINVGNNQYACEACSMQWAYDNLRHASHCCPQNYCYNDDTGSCEQEGTQRQSGLITYICSCDASGCTWTTNQNP